MTVQAVLMASSVKGIVDTVRSDGANYHWLVYSSSALLVLVLVQFWELHRRQRLIDRSDRRDAIPVRPEHRDWLKQHVGGLSRSIDAGADPSSVGDSLRDAMKYHFPETFFMFTAWEKTWNEWQPLRAPLMDDLRASPPEFPGSGDVWLSPTVFSQAMDHYMQAAEFLEDSSVGRPVRTSFTRELPGENRMGPGSWLHFDDLNIMTRLFPIRDDLDELEMAFQRWIIHLGRTRTELHEIRNRRRAMASNRQALVRLLQAIQILPEITIRTTRCDHC